MLSEINKYQADFVLSFAKQDGLNGLVRKLDLDEKNENLVIELQPKLIQAFSNKFPDVELTELDKIVEWIILKAAARLNKK